MTDQGFTLAARTGRSLSLAKGDALEIVNTHGAQVVDTWAFTAPDVGEFMSMEHTRVHAPHPTPRRGTVFVTNRRRPILEFVEDTSPGRHDWFYAACDRYRYEMLGCDDGHANCTDNLRDAMAASGREIGFTPCPLNLFQNTLMDEDMAIRPPVSRPGDRVRLKALTDAIVVLSACPQDMAPTNGANMTPRDVEVKIIPDGRGGD